MTAPANTGAAPRCPVHVGVAMQPIEMERPNWILLSEEEAAQGTRKVWKCAVTGCPRVMVRELTEEELTAKPKQVLCPKCGKPSDASVTARLHSNFKCRACQRKASHELRERLNFHSPGRRGRYRRVPHIRQREAA
jgi:hypothetical protein